MQITFSEGDSLRTSEKCFCCIFRCDDRSVHGWQCAVVKVSYTVRCHTSQWYHLSMFCDQWRFLCDRSRPVITVDVSIFLPVSINITVPQCHEGPQNLNCFNVTVCMSFHGKHVPGHIGKNELSIAYWKIKIKQLTGNVFRTLVNVLQRFS